MVCSDTSSKRAACPVVTVSMILPSWWFAPLHCSGLGTGGTMAGCISRGLQFAGSVAVELAFQDSAISRILPSRKADIAIPCAVFAISCRLAHFLHNFQPWDDLHGILVHFCVLVVLAVHLVIPVCLCCVCCVRPTLAWFSLRCQSPILNELPTIPRGNRPKHYDYANRTRVLYDAQ